MWELDKHTILPALMEGAVEGAFTGTIGVALSDVPPVLRAPAHILLRHHGRNLIEHGSLLVPGESPEPTALNDTTEIELENSESQSTSVSRN